jgi:hypothetical protein
VCPLRELNARILTYAQRFARKLYLSKLCPPDHPVLLSEQELLEMSLSPLRERIIVDSQDLEVVTETIKVLAVDYLYYLVEDDNIRQDLIMQLAMMKSPDFMLQLPYEQYSK